MKILHTIEGMGEQYGGIATCTYDLVTSLQDDRNQVRLMTFLPKNPRERVLGQGEPWMTLVNNDGVGPVNYSSNILQQLKTEQADILHVNGLWQHICHATCAAARDARKPYVITPHGMLYPATLKRSYWKKWPMLKLWFSKDILQASCLHATCEDEMLHLRNFGYRGPICIIGNPVRMPRETESIIALRENEVYPTTIGFLGRLHPRKNVENILRGMEKAGNQLIKAVIIGSGDADYEAFLRAEAERLGVADRVEFAGFVSGREKYEMLGRLSALFVPSDMENFGMIVPEALLVGTPVMASLGTPWKDLNDYGCGWWTDNSPESIARVIDYIVAKSPAELLEMGKRGRELVIERYHPDKVAEKMMQLYSWLLGKGDKPDFVYES